MKQWLEDRGKPTTMAHNMADMKGMDHHNMAAMAMHLIPGMLTPEQMETLAKASGAEFDHLFLTGSRSLNQRVDVKVLVNKGLSQGM